MASVKGLAFGSLALLAAATAFGGSASAQTQQPNILFIMGDDIGWFNIGA
jgi:arylsulfatase